MKKLLTLTLALSLMLSTAVCAAGLEEHSSPVIAMTHTPLYGEPEPFEGMVFMEDSSRFRTEDYRVTLYLYAGGSYYVKPSADNPTVELAADGSFSIPYTIASADRNRIYFKILLLPASYTELPWVVHSQAAFDEILENALDCVSITRTEDGLLTISPDRIVPATMTH